MGNSLSQSFEMCEKNLENTQYYEEKYFQRSVPIFVRKSNCIEHLALYF